MKKNAAVAKNENAVVDCHDFGYNRYIPILIEYIRTNVGHYADQYSLFILWCFTHVLVSMFYTTYRKTSLVLYPDRLHLNNS